MAKVKNCLAVDMGTTAVRACALAKTDAGYQVVGYVQQSTGIEPSMNDLMVNQRRMAALGAVLQQTAAFTKNIVLTLPAKSVYVHSHVFPQVPRSKARQMAKYELDQHIARLSGSGVASTGPDALLHQKEEEAAAAASLDDGDLVFDYQVCPALPEGSPIAIAGCDKEVVEEYLAFLREAKCRVISIEPGSLSAYNWLLAVKEMGVQDESHGYLDIGATGSHVLVERQHRFHSVYSFPIGGNDITNALAQAGNMSFAQAEQLKCTRGSAPQADPQRNQKGEEIVGRVLSRLATEVSRAIAYFGKDPASAVQRMVLIGGGARLRNLAPYLQKQLGKPVRMAEPLRGVAVAPNAQMAAQVAVQICAPLGAALRTLEDVPLQLDLNPADLRGKYDRLLGRFGR